MNIQVKDIKCKEQPKKFVPFTLELSIESEQDLLELIARFNLTPSMVREELQDMDLPSNVGIMEHSCRNWEYLHDLYQEKPYMK